MRFTQIHSHPFFRFEWIRIRRFFNMCDLVVQEMFARNFRTSRSRGLSLTPRSEGYYALYVIATYVKGQQVECI